MATPATLPADYEVWLMTLDSPEPEPRALAILRTLTVHARHVLPGDVLTVTRGAYALRGRYVVKGIRAMRDGRTLIVFQMWSVTGQPFNGLHMAEVNEAVTVDRLS